MTGYQYNVGTSGLAVTGGLTWNSNGTLQKLQITDPFNSGDAQTCTYGYDDLARVNGASCGSVWAQTFSYDPFGNLTKSGSISWNPVYTSANNQYQSGWNGASYDANGNLLTDPSLAINYTWDAAGKLASANGTSATYDVLGRMVELGGVTQFVYGPSGQQPLLQMRGHTLDNAYVPLPGGTFAIYKSSGLFQYNHADWLGSTRVISTPSRTVSSDMAYAPFGEGYSVTGTGWAQFTSAGNSWTVQVWQNRGLDDFLYRRYSPVQGRWISPDPAGLAAVDPSNPQTWNRYAYVMNNPLSFIDPFGLRDCEPSDSACVVAPPPNPVDASTFSINGCSIFSMFCGPDFHLPAGPTGPANNTRPSKTACFLRGAAVGAGGALVVGGLAVGAVALGAPAAAVTGVLLVAGSIGGASTLYSAGTNVVNGNYAGAAYDVGSLAGGAATGGLIGGAVGDSINPPATRGWSLSRDWANRFNPGLGSIGKWLGTGPDAAAAGGSTAGAGSGILGFLRGPC